MQIVIPMSGFGERFRRAGYKVPKPLIEVEGKPIIAHVVDLFPEENDFVFICNQQHLDQPSYEMRRTLLHYSPNCKIVGIPPHKLGPVNAVLCAASAIDLQQPTIVNYCDFACLWDYSAFRNFVEENNCDGAIPCYRGFHPHMLHSVNYAYVRTRGCWIDDIREKQPFTQTPMDEYASSGTYYFKTGAVMLSAFQNTIARPDLALKGEFYVSLAFKPMLESGMRVAVFEVEHFMQWGTPEDLADYLSASNTFRLLAEHNQVRPVHAGAVMVPLAGAGSRFTEAGYTAPKPLIPVSGRPLTTQAASDLPAAAAQLFILRRDLPYVDDIQATIARDFPQARFVMLESLTDGQARTCLMAMSDVELNAPLTIGACDNGLLYDAAAFSRLLDDSATDVIVWGVRGHPGARRRPQMYGWIDADASGHVRRVSVKAPLSEPAQDPIVVGAFSFKRASDFVNSAERLISRDGRVNGEFYIDTCLNDALALRLNVRLFEVDAYLCWGTPEELKTFEYWQQAFDRWPAHPYRRALDADFKDQASADQTRR